MSATRQHGRRGQRGRRTLLAFAVLVVGAVGASTAGWATEARFSDVPPGHAFADEIDWMADTGITTGFPDDTFRPGAAVSRGSMSAFMQRLFDLRNPVATASDVNFTDGWALDWADFATASVTVVVPPGTEALLLADFTARSDCYSGGIDGGCWARLVVNGTEMSPQQPIGEGYILASNDDATHTSNDTEGHSLVRHHGPVGPGTYTIKVQTRVSTLGVSYGLADWTLVGEAILLPA
jgi:hypothetical protein